MIKTLISLVTFFAIAVHAASPPPVTIASLPFHITAPGTYVLAGNLTFSGPYYTAIGVGDTVGITGQVIIDFKGFTISGNFSTGNYTCVTIQGGTPNIQSSVIIQNGTISAFGLGVISIGWGLPGPKVLMRNMSFNQNGTGVFVSSATGTTVIGCKFVGFSNGGPTGSQFATGIEDYGDGGNNHFDNNTFVYVYTPIELHSVSGAPISIVNAQIYPSGVKP